MKVREVVKRIEADGWVFARYGGRSSHRIYEKPGVPDKVVVLVSAVTKCRRAYFRMFAESRGCRSDDTYRDRGTDAAELVRLYP